MAHWPLHVLYSRDAFTHIPIGWEFVVKEGKVPLPGADYHLKGGSWEWVGHSSFFQSTQPASVLSSTLEYVFWPFIHKWSTCDGNEMQSDVFTTFLNSVAGQQARTLTGGYFFKSQFGKNIKYCFMFYWQHWHIVLSATYHLSIVVYKCSPVSC